MQTILNNGAMLLQIPDILTPPECAAIAAAIAQETLWRDGRDTAQGAARSVKENLQADRSAPSVKGALAKIEAALGAHDVFSAAAQPAQFIRMTFNRYGEGMSYGDHVDAPYIEGARTDLSFTVFLSDPNDYAGGELVIDNAGHEDRVKGPLGSVVLYPSASVHRVATVTAGARLACIGWVKSRVRSAENRERLFELETVLADLRRCGTPQAVYNRLLNLRNNLLRAYGD
ncbi:MAG: Fe2+-dependent dioxygenase [Parvularculaceae bacterium]